MGKKKEKNYCKIKNNKSNKETNYLRKEFISKKENIKKNLKNIHKKNILKNNINSNFLKNILKIILLFIYRESWKQITIAQSAILYT